MITAITANTNYNNLGFKSDKSTTMKFYEKVCLMKPEEKKAFVDTWKRKYRTIGKRMVADSLKPPKVDSCSKSVTDPINDNKRLSQEDAERLGLNFKFFPIVNIKK